MYKMYIVPDATTVNRHSVLHNSAQLLWDPYTESDAYAVLEGKWKSELNKADSVEFSVLPSNVHYGDFHKRKTVILLYDDDTLLFEGVVSDAPSNFYKQRNVKCSGPLTYLCDSIQAPDEKNVIEVPTSDMSNSYLDVPEEWLSNANPSGLNWYERTYSDSEGKLKYTKTSDQQPIAGKSYYYVSVGDGENHSGQIIVKKGSTSESISEHITRLLDVHNSQVNAFKKIHVGNIAGGSAKHDFDSSNYRTTWDALKSDILDEYGRYFRIRIGEDNELYLDYLDISSMASGNNLPIIEYANNMREFSEADNANNDIFTVLVPLGKDNLTVQNVQGHDSNTYSDNRLVDPYIVSWNGNRRYVVVSPRAIEEYGYIVKPQTFSDVSTASALYDRAVEYIKNNFDDHKEYDVKALDLHIINGTSPRIAIANKCIVRSTWHGVNESSLYVITAERDLVNPENDSFKIGMPTSDREAMNRTLTGQSNNAKRKQNKDAASASSGMSRMNSILEDYIHVTEWGLEMNSRLKNEVESKDKKYMTRFVQDEDNINLAAQKLFGYDEDGVGDLDSGYVKVQKSDYKKSANGPYKKPVDEHWYEKKLIDGKTRYVLSEDTTCDPSVVGNKDYYIQKLWTRYSEIDVGEGGIKARVDGNYARSTASSSWIDVNEKSILALTGHLYVDEDGHVHVTAGSGMLTDDSSEPSEPTFIPVSPTMYKDANGNDVSPATKKWYEPVFDSSNAWIGEGKADKTTNPAYYTLSKDTTVNRNKHYYYYSRVRETFSAQYGIFDEDNLTAGVMVRAINNPSYHLISYEKRVKAQKQGKNPHELGWYEYDDSTGLYGITLDNQVLGDPASYDMKEYFEVVNQMQKYTNIMGDHVVIGGRLDENGDPIIFDGVNDATKARIHKYIDGHKLDGTITEIASDVLYAKAVFTNYLNVLSHKLVGDASDDENFTAIDKTKAGYSNMNPSAEGWCEKNPSTGEYFLTADDKVDPDKTYYETKLMTRITSLEVGEGGIHATVKGNYDRSIASQAWIRANEEKLEMLLGHVGEDADGNLVIDSGTGFKTGHAASSTVTARYVLVLRSEYAGANPNSLGWKERKIGSDGRWVGAGKPDEDTNSNYYITSSDTSADYTKQYYISSTTAETYVSEFGVYDQGNLTAGVVAQAVNNPKYIAIHRKYQPSDINPSTASTVKLPNGSTVSSMWYVYNEENGLFGQTTDTTMVPNHIYYYVQNNMSTYTSIHGDHIVVGSPDGQSQLNDATRAKINKYITDHNLDGTIMEIASDIVVVNTLIAKYIEADDITANTSLWTDSFHANTASIEEHLYCPEIVADDIWWRGNPQHDASAANSLKHNTIMVFATEDDNNKTLTASVSGDDVTISFMTMDSVTRSVTFTKPASLGSVTWSYGNYLNKLKVETAGGKEFFYANLTIPTLYLNDGISYAKTGNDLEENFPYAILKTKPVIKASMNVRGLWSGNDEPPTGEDDFEISAWSHDIYLDATKPYNDGWGQAQGCMNWPSPMQALGERTSLTIKYPSATVDAPPEETVLTLLDADAKGSSGYVRLYRDYIDDDHRGNMVGAIQVGDWYTDGWGQAQRQMDWPEAMQALGERTSFNVQYPSSTVDGDPATTTFTLLDADAKGSSGYVRVYTGYQDDSHRGNMVGAIQVGDWYTAGVAEGYSSAITTVRTRSSSNKNDGEDISLGIGGYSTVYAQYKTKADFDAGNDRYQSLTGIKIYSPDVRIFATYDGSDYTTDSTISLGYGNSVDVKTQKKSHDENDYSDYRKLKVKAPSAGSHRAHASYGGSDYAGNGTIYPDYNEYVTVYSQWKGDFDNDYGPDSILGITIKTPSKPTAQGATEAVKSNATYNDGDEYTLEYDDSIKIYGKFKTSLDSDYTNCSGITVKSKSDRYNTGYDTAVGTLAISPSTSQTIDYGDSVTVKATVTNRDNTTTEKTVTLTARSKPTISAPASATAPEGVTPTSLSSDTTYEVHLVHNETNRGNTIYFKTPASSSTSHSIDIPNSGFDVSTSEPSGTKLTYLRDAIKEAIRDKEWLYFTVKCGSATKIYYMDFS